MNPNPLVSIVTPAFNAAATLGATVQSIVAQTWTNWELYIVDDGSIDDTIKIARQFADVRIKVVEQRRKGAAAARNSGFALAKGEYVKFMDADDLLNSTALEDQVRQLQQCGDSFVSSCGWVRFHGAVPGNEVPEPEPVWRESAPLEWLRKAWTGGGMMVTGCWLIPTALARRAGPWDETRMVMPNDDGEYFTRILLASSGVKFCERALLHYRTGVAGSLSQVRSHDAAEAILNSYQKMQAALLAADTSDESRFASAANFARFVYEYHPTYPHLVERAAEEMEKYRGPKAPLFSSPGFRRICRYTGYRNALTLRRLLRPLLEGRQKQFFKADAGL